MNASYPDAEVRGQLRRWKSELKRGCIRYDAQVTDRRLLSDAIAFCRRSSAVGRRRAFGRLAGAIGNTGAVLEGVRFGGRHPVAVWSILAPRDSVRVEPDNPADAQNCVAVNYIVACETELSQGGLHYGLWTLEIPDHALGRMMHRGVADLAATLRAAHHAALRLRIPDVVPNGKLDRSQQSPEFLLAAGPGAFICRLRWGPDISDSDRPLFHVRAATWLHNDQLRADQIPLFDDGTASERLGDVWLLPRPMRRLEMGTEGITAWVWSAGMPETLVMPAGRA